MWDGFFIMGGLWLVPLLLTFSLLPNEFLLMSLILTSVLWLSHRVATFFTIFCTPTYRGLIAAEPMRFFVVPGVVLLLSVGAALCPFPESALVRLQILGTIFLLLNTYHFGVQHFGVLTIYRIRGGQRISDAARDSEKRWALVLGGVLVLVGQLLHGADVIQESIFASFVPATSTTIPRILGIGIALLGGILTLKAELNFTPRCTPKVLYKVALTIQAVSAFLLPALPFVILWAVQHWLVSVGLALHMAGNSNAVGDSTPVNDPPHKQGLFALWLTFWNYINRRPLAAAGVLALFSIAFTPLILLPTKLVGGTLHGNAMPDLVGWFSRHPTMTLVLVGLNFGTVFCHFLYDRAVFRFSHAPTRAVSGQLLFAQRGS